MDFSCHQFRSLNAVVAHIARTVYNIPNVIARNFDPQYRSLLEAFDLQIVSSSSWGAQRIEELLSYTDIFTVFSAGNGEVEIYEFTIPKELSGIPLVELLSPDGVIPIAITRAGKASLAVPESTLKENDILLVSATFDGIQTLRTRLHEIQEG
jgi:trk system potassium uptake protein TrkA